MKPLDLQNLSKIYSAGSRYEVRALDGVSITLNENEVTGLIGPNGAGKTTLLRCVMGFEKPDSGEVLVYGYPTNTIEAKKCIGFQSDAQYRTPKLSVESFLKMNAQLAGVADPMNMIVEYLETFHLTQSAKKALSKLSRGMRQKVELISAFIGSPKLILLDEPTSALDPPSVMELRDFINRKKGSSTILFSSHHLSEVEKVCDRVIFIENGKITGDHIVKELEPGFLEEKFRNYESKRELG